MFDLRLLATSVQIWLFVFGLYLIIYNSLFTIFPTSLLGIILIYVLLHQFRNPLPPVDIVSNIFGEPYKFTNDSSPLKPDRDIAGSESSKEKTSGGPFKDRLWIVGHRGCGLDAPENSLIAFTKCAERGGTSVEFDVTFTKDSVPVLFHDDNLFRMTGIDKEISDINYSELESIDLATKHPLAYKLERPIRIPTLDEAIETCLEKGLRFFIDIKARDYKIVDVILKAYKKYPGMYQTAIISSFDPKVIYEVRRNDPNIIGCMAWRPGYCRYSGWDCSGEHLEKRYSLFLKDWGAIIADYLLTWAVKNLLWWFIGLSAILVSKDAITREDTFIWTRERGLRLFLWTTNNPIEKLYTSEGLNIGYLTDTMDGDFSVTGQANLSTSRTSEHQLRLTRSSDLFVTPSISQDGNSRN